MSKLLPEVVSVLACPVCDAGMADVGSSLRCENGHVFDVARQGYVNLLKPGSPHAGDTAEMLAERDAVLSEGIFAPLEQKVAALLAAEIAEPNGLILDIGAGTGHYLGRALEALPEAHGLALDVSKYAARRAAKAHPRASSAVCDVWEALPVRSASVSAILNIFSPRNPVEMARVCRPDAVLLVVVPASEHLSELVQAFGLLSVQENKLAEVTEALSPWFCPVRSESVKTNVELNTEQALAVALMGPSAHHLTREKLSEVTGYLPEPVSVTLSAVVSVFRTGIER